MAFDAAAPRRGQTIGEVIDSANANDVALKAQIDDHAGSSTAHGLAAVATAIADYLAHKASDAEHGLPAVRSSAAASAAALVAAAGSAATLAARLAAGLNADGTLKLSSLASKWITPGDVPTFVDATHLSVPTDRRGVFIAGAILRLTVSGGYVYAPVASSAFAAGVTTVTLDPAYPVLTAGLSALDLALIAFDNSIGAAVGTLNALMVTMQAAIAVLQVLELSAGRNGAPAGAEVLLRYVATRAFTLPAGLAGCRAKAATAATASAVLALAKNGVNFGTATFAAAGSSATFAAAAATSFAAGDVLTITAPAVADATLAGLAINLLGTLQ